MGDAEKKSRDGLAPAPLIQFRAEFELPSGLLVQLPGAQLWNEVFPVEDGDLGHSEEAGDGNLSTAEVVNDVSFVHPARLHMLNCHVKTAERDDNYSVPAMETMGDRIRTLRQSRGWTQEELGERIGVTKVSVSQWETGITSNIRLKTFIALYEELQTTPHYLIFGVDHKQARKRSPQP